jgi:hypothetical protein
VGHEGRVPPGGARAGLRRLERNWREHLRPGLQGGHFLVRAPSRGPCGVGRRGARGAWRSW